MKKLQIAMLACLSAVVTCAANMGEYEQMYIKTSTLGVYIKNNTKYRLLYEAKKIEGDKPLEWKQAEYGATFVAGAQNLPAGAEKRLPYSFNASYAVNKGLSEESIGVKIYSPTKIQEFVIAKATVSYPNMSPSYCMSTSNEDCLTFEELTEYTFGSHFKVSIQNEESRIVIIIDPIEAPTKSPKKPGWKFWE